MIPIEQITEKELEKRFDALPPKLQEALASEENMQTVGQICNAHHVADEEKILIVQQLAGLVVLGFIHYYDTSSEISEAAGVDKRITDQIAREMEAKIFNAIKTELENNYHPLLAEEKPAPVSFDDIKKPSAPPLPVPTKAPMPLTSSSDLPATAFASAGALAKGGPSPSATLKPISVAAPTPPRPNPFPATDSINSPQTNAVPVAPTIRSSTPSTESKPPTPFDPTQGKPPASFPSRAVPSVPAPVSLSTPPPPVPFGGSGTKPTPTPASIEPPVVSPSTPLGTSRAEPAPMMLHEEVVMKAIRPPSSFNLNISSLPKSLDAKPKETIPVRPAVLELGGSTPLTTSSASKTPTSETKMPRVVHYTELRTPLSPSPTNGPAPTPKPTPSPMPPAIAGLPPTAGPVRLASLGSTRDKQGEREVHEITAITPPAPSAAPLQVKPAFSPAMFVPKPQPPAPVNIPFVPPAPPKLNDVRPFGIPPPPAPPRPPQLPPRPPTPPGLKS